MRPTIPERWGHQKHHADVLDARPAYPGSKGGRPVTSEARRAITLAQINFPAPVDDPGEITRTHGNDDFPAFLRRRPDNSFLDGPPATTEEPMKPEGPKAAQLRAQREAKVKDRVQPRATKAKLQKMIDAKTAPTNPAPSAEQPKEITMETATETTKPKAKAKTKPAKKAAAKKTAKPAKKAAAKAKVAALGIRPGSKLEIVAKLLTRPEGCTTADVLKATEWPSVSVPQQAKAAGLKLRKIKVKGEPTRYHGDAA